MRWQRNGIVHALARNNSKIVVFLIAVIVGLAAYWPSFYADFQFDDYHAIVRNHLIKHLDIPTLWRQYTSQFLPYLSFAVNYQLSGFNVLSWHVVNFIIHLMAAVCAYQLTALTLRSPRLAKCYSSAVAHLISLSTGLIFLVHPIQTQGVTYIVQRATSLAGFLCLAAVYWYARARIDERPIFYVAAGLCVAAAVVTKPVVIILPALLLLYEIFFIGTHRRARRWSLIFGAIALIVVLLPPLLIGITRLDTSNPAILSPARYLLTQCNVILTYIRLLFIPANQNLDYDYPVAQSLFEFPTIASCLILIGIAIGALYIARKHRLMSFGILWFFISISPQSSIYPLRDVIFEHRVYLGCYGFAVFLSSLLYTVFRKEKKYAVIVCAIILLLSVATYRRNALWSDGRALAEDVASKSPNKARARSNLGFVYHRDGQFGLARAEYLMALAINPRYFPARNNLANLYLDEGHPARAQREFHKLIKQQPHYPDAYVGLAQTHERLGDAAGALQLFYKALELAPHTVAAHIGLGTLYQEGGDFYQAEQFFRAALAYDPSNTVAYYDLGNTYFLQGDYYAAFQQYRRALALNPRMASALHNIGFVYFLMGDHESAMRYFADAIASDDSLPEAYLSLANVQHMVGRIDEARHNAERAAALYTAQGRADKAREITEQLRLTPIE